MTIKVNGISLLIFALANALQTAKISYSLSQNLETNGVSDIAIQFKENTQPILEKVGKLRFETRGHKITSIKTQLEQLAKDSQQNVISILRSRSTSFKSFWINNKIIVKGASQELINAIAAIPEVSGIREELLLHIANDEEQGIPASTKQEEVEWGVRMIEADQAWELVGGNNGQGVVVGTIDTGVRATHETLRDNYRNPYGWYDAVTRTPNPNNMNGHGSHVLGIIAGSHGIGVAPGAQWAICRACRNILGGITCSEADVITCGEWMLCPTLPNGQQADCSKAPNIVSNSWGITRKGGNDFYAEVVNAWRAANMIPIFRIGDGRQTCGDVYSPGDYPNVIGVGAVSSDDILAGVSGRGPTLDGRVKPDVTAPGIDIRSADMEGDAEYWARRGTSFSAPHVAGTVALLLARNPDLTFDQVKNLLQDNAERDVGYSMACGQTNYTVWPNNLYGYGRINARRALTALIGGSA